MCLSVLPRQWGRSSGDCNAARNAVMGVCMLFQCTKCWSSRLGTYGSTALVTCLPTACSKQAGQGIRAVAMVKQMELYNRTVGIATLLSLASAALNSAYDNLMISPENMSQREHGRPHVQITACKRAWGPACHQHCCSAHSSELAHRRQPGAAESAQPRSHPPPCKAAAERGAGGSTQPGRASAAAHP